MSEIKERPILFSAEMVRAILEGRKTQTRRIVKPQPDNELKWMGWLTGTSSNDDKLLGSACWTDDFPLSKKEHYVRCPYGRFGDRLWVRETFVFEYFPSEFLEIDETAPKVEGNRPVFHHPQEVYEFDEEFWLIPYYRATDPAPELVDVNSDGPSCKWRPSIFMPRWSSRILLEITNIRVERVQEITIEDCVAEGIYDSKNLEFLNGSGIEKQEYCLLWDKINKSRGYSWESNPWVWVIEFKVLEVKK